MKNFGKLALLGAALAVSSSSAFATIIPITTTLATTGSALATMSGSLVSNGGVAPTYTANYTESVYDYVTGGKTYLAFKYTVSDAGVDSISNMSTNYAQFTDAALMLEYVSGDTVDGTQTQGTGTVNVNFTGGLDSGGTSTFILFTDATQYTPGPVGFRDTYPTQGGGLIPATPEPNSLILLGTGLVGAAGMLMRRRRLTA